ncbi:unnamed protein product [Pleuronectes platessa]|uniref:2-aminoethanethiol dioxygenase n=1 Tax=Pleuronectes platessa TaxID=8262 RepID=A0A9N7YAC7_PLEPL|nr:unnamed protein product [Pleuronectes platessa]
MAILIFFDNFYTEPPHAVSSHGKAHPEVPPGPVGEPARSLLILPIPLTTCSRDYRPEKERAHLAGDGKIAPRKSKPSSGAAGLQSPPVTYMHICGMEVFSMGVFLLRPGTSMPLHDHPDMNGNLRSC